jgi:hypothetical protein
MTYFRLAWSGFGLFLLSCGVAAELEEDLNELEEGGEEAAANLNANLDDLEEQIENLDVEFTMQHTRFDAESGEFVELTPPNVKRNLMSIAVVSEQILLLGGLNEDGNYSNALETYDVESDSWRTLQPRAESGFSWDLVVGDLLCSVGGYKDLDTPIRRDVECYDLAADEWTEREQVPRAYASFVPVSVGGKVLIPGGLDADLNAVNDLWQYDPATDAWTELAPLPFGFVLGGAVVLENEVYLVGGFKVHSDDEEAPSDRDMLVYNVATDTWRTAPDMPHWRALYATDAVEGHVTAFFGVTEAGAPLVDFYDPEQDQWFPGTDPPEPPDGGVYSYVRHQDQMHLFTLASGVSGGSTTSNGELWRYSVADDQWRVVGTRTSGEDALFIGASLGAHLHFVGAKTTVLH